MKSNSLILLLVFLLGCDQDVKDRHLSTETNIKSNHGFSSEAKINDTLNAIANRHEYGKGILMVDSLIRLNKMNGFLYYGRGGLKLGKDSYAEALVDLKMAKKLGYYPDRCDELIEFCEEMIDDERKSH